MPPPPRGIVRKDYTLLREGQADDLFEDVEAGSKAKGATVWRLFGLAKQEVWVSGACHRLYFRLTCNLRRISAKVQVILLATMALAVASLSSIAVPKLAGDLIDICISYGQKSFDEATAKHKLDGKLTSTAMTTCYCL